MREPGGLHPFLGLVVEQAGVAGDQTDRQPRRTARKTGGRGTADAIAHVLGRPGQRTDVPDGSPRGTVERGHRVATPQPALEVVVTERPRADLAAPGRSDDGRRLAVTAEQCALPRGSPADAVDTHERPPAVGRRRRLGHDFDLERVLSPAVGQAGQRSRVLDRGPGRRTECHAGDDGEQHGGRGATSQRRSRRRHADDADDGEHPESEGD